MAGKVVVSTLNNDTGVLATQNGMTGIAKAWGQFTISGTTPVINSSFNISSVTRTGAGRFYVDFTTAMPNANYSVVANGSIDTSFGAFTFIANAGVAAVPYYIAPTTTRFYFSAIAVNGVAYDPYYTTFAIFSS
jgi:hypothetical protein